ncbi:hypothetical protein [Mycobacterium angelicum]|uniref:Uncharacterized protein n=1 Tax=Mycobacterium angelicum TaxID=470074 RepID=A0A1W9ZSH0_MYCAN|nr:hypothetical protein [Mycobacterium angelicum]MCV7199365.1 hypothetical protein [Mycobacterium angelicum]ORA20486.1 hypothetical protein BST12_15065 [Mycobacterium angelicum]
MRSTHTDLQFGPESRYPEDGPGMGGNLLSPAPRARRWRKWLAVTVAVVLICLVVGAVAGIITARETKRAASSHPVSAAVTPLQEWWLRASDDFTEVQRASVDVVRAARIGFPEALEPACLHLHDAAEVKLQSRLPSPDSELTAELRGAIEDFHSAAHMCLSTLAGAKTNYHSEFVAYLFLADRQMTAAQERINKTLMRSA